MCRGGSFISRSSRIDLLCMYISIPSIGQATDSSSTLHRITDYGPAPLLVEIPAPSPSRRISTWTLSIRSTTQGVAGSLVCFSQGSLSIPSRAFEFYWYGRENECLGRPFLGLSSVRLSNEGPRYAQSLSDGFQQPLQVTKAERRSAMGGEHKE